MMDRSVGCNADPDTYWACVREQSDSKGFIFLLRVGSFDANCQLPIFRNDDAFSMNIPKKDRYARKTFNEGKVKTGHWKKLKLVQLSERVRMENHL